MRELNGGGDLDSLSAILFANKNLVFSALLLVALFVAARRLLAGKDESGRQRGLTNILIDAFTTNWQLTLLATTAFVLSLASGWTTWDGMRNFTGEPILSLMVTFGIQGVMLIIAWLIGESFAAGMHRRQARSGASGRSGAWSHIEPFVGMLVGALCAVALITALANMVGAFDDFRAASSGHASWTAFADKTLYLGVGLLVFATLLINQRSDIIQPYMQSARVIAKNAMLWVMFLSCMATSVFFSFDSLFSHIFSQEERKRAADIRAARQVAGAVADIGALASRRQGEEAELLFKSEGWASFAKNLDALSRASQGAEQQIERFFVEKMEQRRAAIAEQQERISTARSGQAGLVTKKASLTDEMSRMKAERPALAADLAAKKTELENRAKGIDAKRVEVMAEERGAEGSLKVGRGPIYRQRTAELQQLQDAYKIQEERVRDATKRLANADQRISSIGRELAAVDGDIAKLKGEAETAQQRISVASASKENEEDVPKVDPARVRAAFERAHNEFRRSPTVANLNALSQQCTQLYGAMASTPATKDRVRNIDCDPKDAIEAAGKVFALNAGLVTFARTCAGGDKLPVSGGTDAMLDFGRKCLQDSGLPSKDSGDMAAKISAIDLNRDDKAHRFVVTWNAFVDGNRLAYLALAIAIAIDSLVFMSGLFGANALRSPLTEIEDRGEMTADQLEATIDAALGETPHPRQTLTALLSAMHPIQSHDGFTSELTLDDRDPLAEEMRQVLVAGAIIGAVRRVGSERGHYLVHAGLARYLAVAQRKPWQIKSADVDRKELVNVIGVALLPDPQGNAETVLSYIHPISDSERFSAETYPFRDISIESDRRLVLNTLGAGATIRGSVDRDNHTGRFLVSTDFYKTLLLMRAAAIPAFRPDVVAARYGRMLPDHGGSHAGGGHGAAALPPGSEPPTRLQAEPIRQLPDHTQHAEVRAPEQPGSRPEITPDQQPRQSPPRKMESSGPSVPAPLGQAAAAGMTPPALPGGVRPANDVSNVPAPPKPDRRHENPIASQLASKIRSDIINGNLHPWDDREMDDAYRSQFSEGAIAALNNLIAREHFLGPKIGAELEASRARVSDRYEELREIHARDSRYIEVLETEVEKLLRSLPVLFMTETGPYEQIAKSELRTLRSKADDLADQVGNGRLTDAEIVLMQNLGDHIQRLTSIQKNAINRLELVAQVLDDYDEHRALNHHVASGNGRRQPPLT